MDKLIVNMFNGGDNDGNVVLVCNDGASFRCHSFVVKRCSPVLKMLIVNAKNGRGEFKDKNDGAIQIRVDYSSYVMKALVSYMYTSATHTSFILTIYKDLPKNEETGKILGSEVVWRFTQYIEAADKYQT